MADEPVQARELMARRYQPGTTVTNCLKHAHMGLLDRPEDCRLCSADIRNQLARALAVNEWLNRWRDDALDVLTRHDAALHMLQGWTVRHRGDRADVIRRRVEGEPEWLVREVPAVAATMIDLYLHSVVEVADGLAPAVNVQEGEPHGSR